MHNALYIKQRNKCISLVDYELVESKTSGDFEFRLIRTDLSGFIPFMCCLGLFIQSISTTMTDEMRDDVIWGKLWLEQLYTVNVAANEKVLHHCIFRSVKTKKAGDIAIKRWYKHKARWMDEYAPGEVSSVLHLVKYDEKTVPFFIASRLKPPGVGEIMLDVMLDADSTHMHSKSNTKCSTMHIAFMGEDSKVESVRKYELRPEVKRNLPSGYKIVDAKDVIDDDSVHKLLKRRSSIAYRFENGEWFIGDVISSNRKEGTCDVLFSTFRPDFVGETYELTCTFGNYDKDWVFVTTLPTK